MSEQIVAASEELVRRLASGLRASQLYAPSHPIVKKQTAGLSAALEILHQQSATVVIGLVAGQVVVGDVPLPRLAGQMFELIDRLTRAGVERIAITRGATPRELETFTAALARSIAGADTALTLNSDNIRIGRLASDADAPAAATGHRYTLRRLYGDAVGQAESIWESALTEGRPDVKLAAASIESLAEAVIEHRTALIALAAMKKYDNYTFTHMVNVSILTMAQARALGIEGTLLREFGLSALMHDIGKVKTPKDILNKPSKLDDREFQIMKRHTIDGAAMLRQTPEMPSLSAVVAFEHHLRLDGQGYPDGVKRETLNLGTMLCSIADVYDAMRAQRVYKDAFPTDRILAVLAGNDGLQFDQHLVRRFVQLMGIYPPGSLVTLSDGRLALVTAIHAPIPERPTVRVLFESDSTPAAAGPDLDLWADAARDLSITAVVDPATVGLDPIRMLK
ncbi:MAG TPA: HD-GYP domain-containing protein [Vicinamibacterales bacterium]|nr:HD-GYP domain-containing protein [Vicinamibacterales bacterium]